MKVSARQQIERADMEYGLRGGVVTKRNGVLCEKTPAFN